MKAGGGGPIQRWKLVLGAGPLGIVALGGFTAIRFVPGYHQAAPAASVRVAVLPFDNLSSDPADAYIARSIPEMVLNRLSTIQGLTVISRDSSLLSLAAIGRRESRRFRRKIGPN